MPERVLQRLARTIREQMAELPDEPAGIALDAHRLAGRENRPRRRAGKRLRLRKVVIGDKPVVVAADRIGSEDDAAGVLENASIDFKAL